MTYAVKEMYVTLQGEGAHTGRAAVFCRFAGCNLWTGREADRETAVCRFATPSSWGPTGRAGVRLRIPNRSRRRSPLCGMAGAAREGARSLSSPAANHCCNWTNR